MNIKYYLIISNFIMDNEIELTKNNFNYAQFIIVDNKHNSIAEFPCQKSNKNIFEHIISNSIEYQQTNPYTNKSEIVINISENEMKFLSEKAIIGWS